MPSEESTSEEPQDSEESTVGEQREKYTNKCFRCGEDVTIVGVIGGRIPCHDCHVEMKRIAHTKSVKVNERILP